MIHLPKQRISYSKKNKAWRKDNIDYRCSQADSQYIVDYARMQENYNLHNNVLNQNDYKRFADPLGVDDKLGRDYVQAFNHTYNKINVLVGEEQKRPWEYSAISSSEDVSNEVIRDKTRDMQRLIDFNLQKEVAKNQQKIQLQVQQQTQGLPPDQAKQQQEALMQELQQMEQRILNPEQIAAKYKNYKVSRETLMEKLLRRAEIAYKLRHKKNQTFFHANVSGVEAIEVSLMNNQVNVEVLNPLGLAYHKSPEVQFIQDGDYVVYRRRMTMSDVMDHYGKDMEEDDLRTLDSQVGGIFGLDAKMYSQGGWDPSHFENLVYRRGRFSAYGMTDFHHLGQFGQELSTDFDYLNVYTIYWKSFRKIGFYTTINEYGDEIQQVVDEAFTVPKYAKNTSYSDDDGETRSRKEWINAEGMPEAIEWDWIPEVWQGTRIESNIYVNIRPITFQYMSMEDPKRCKLPVYGVAHNGYNAPIVSTMDRMKPWQKLYLMVMSKWLELIAKDQGVINMFNTLLLDPKFDLDKTLRYMRDTGVMPYNPLANAEGAERLGNTMKPGEALDLSSKRISEYTQILQFIEANIGEAAGVSKPREGQTSTYSNVGDNKQDIMQSSHITEAIFSLHDLLWEDVLNGVVQMMQLKYSRSKSKTERFILDEDEISILEIGEGIFDNLDYDVQIANNGRAAQSLEFLKQNAVHLLQNQQNALSMLTKLMTTDSLSEFGVYIKQIEDEIGQQAQQAQQAQQQTTLQVQQMKSADLQKDRDLREDLETMKTNAMVHVAEINSFSRQKNQDSNDDGIPDQLEIEKLRQSGEDTERYYNLEQAKLDAKTSKEAEDTNTERQKIASQEKVAQIRASSIKKKTGK